MAKRMNHETHGRAIRTTTVDPYGKDGPTFTLHCFDGGDGGIAYELWSRDKGKRVQLFEGVDYNTTVKPASDLGIALLFAQLTAPRTDEDMTHLKFTDEQKAFVRMHGEAVYKETYERFRQPLALKPKEAKATAVVSSLPQHRFRISGGQQVTNE